MNLIVRLAMGLAASLILAAGGAAQGARELVQAANERLADSGANVRIESAEYLTPGESGEVGQTVLFNNRGNKQLAFDFVPGDPRRGGGTDITYITDPTQPSADAVDTLGAIDSAMNTWESVQCSNIPIVDLGETSADEGFVSTVFGFGGNPDIDANPADIVHAGFLPPAFFLQLGSANILGVTFTIIFVDANDDPTDIDGNGAGDAAYREIYYNDGFTWVNDPNDVPGNGLFDLETVALHEAGHGLSQAHFGKAFITTSNGKLHFAPLAVMNAGYIVGQQNLKGTDVSGHCSNWASWPRN